MTLTKAPENFSSLKNLVLKENKVNERKNGCVFTILLTWTTLISVFQYNRTDTGPTCTKRGALTLFT